MKRKCKKLDEVRFSQYGILTSTYDQRLAAIQTVIIICVTFSSAVIVVLCTELSVFDIMFGKIDENANIISALILSVMAFFHSLFCLISIESQAKSSEDLRKILFKLELKYKIYTMHSKNKLKIPIRVTKISTAITTIFFFICALFCLFRLMPS